MGPIAHVSKRRKYLGLTVVGSPDTSPRELYDEIRTALREYYCQKSIDCCFPEFDPGQRKTEFPVHETDAQGKAYASGLVRIVRGDSHNIQEGRSTIFRYYLFFEQSATADREEFFRYVLEQRNWPSW